MRVARLWRGLAIVAVLLAAATVGAVVVAHTSWARARALNWATTFLDARYPRPVSGCAAEVRLAAKGHEDVPFFTARRVEVRLPRSVYSGIFAIDSLTIDGGASDIVRDEDGVSNLPPSGGGPTPLVPRRINLRAIAFENFTFRYIDRLRDLAPARALGGRALHVLTGTRLEDAAISEAGFEQVSDLAAAVNRAIGVR